MYVCMYVCFRYFLFLLFFHLHVIFILNLTFPTLNLSITNSVSLLILYFNLFLPKKIKLYIILIIRIKKKNFLIRILWLLPKNKIDSATINLVSLELISQCNLALKISYKC